MKRAGFGAVILALALLLGGCSQEEAIAPAPLPSESPSPSPVPTPAPVTERREFALAYDPQGTWDPYAGSGNANMTLAPLVYEGLYALDNTFSPSQVLARSASVSEDGLVWTVTLREGVTFSDGTPLTAQLAGQAARAAQGKGSAYATRLGGVEKVGWDQELTLSFTLKAPNRDFTALLDFPIALVTGDGCFGTGPYTVGDGSLVARRDWWQGKSLPQRAISLHAVTGADDLIAGFDSGDLSLAAADLSGADALGYSGVCQTWGYPTGTMLYVGYRCGGGFCAEKGFRQALGLAFDREGLVEEVLGGHAAAAAYPAPPAAKRYNAAAARQGSYDPEKAAEKLAGLGFGRKEEDGPLYKGRNPVSLTFLVNSDNSVKVRAAHALADDLGALGIAVTVKAVGWEAYQKALTDGQFDLYLGECRLTGDLDLTPFLTYGSGLCFGDIWDPELSDALAAARSSGVWGTFDRMWMESAPLSTLCFKTGTVLTAWGRCEGLEPTQGNLFYGLEHWKIT